MHGNYLACLAVFLLDSYLACAFVNLSCIYLEDKLNYPLVNHPGTSLANCQVITLNDRLDRENVLQLVTGVTHTVVAKHPLCKFCRAPLSS